MILRGAVKELRQGTQRAAHQRRRQLAEGGAAREWYRVLLLTICKGFDIIHTAFLADLRESCGKAAV